MAAEVQGAPITDEEFDDNDLDDDDDEEILEGFGPDDLQKLEDMIQARRAQLQESNDKYKQWLDMITRRRMFAFSRIRKLEKSRQDRKRFLSTMAAVVSNAVQSKDEANSTGQNMDDETKSSSAAPSAANEENKENQQSSEAGPARGDEASHEGVSEGEYRGDTPFVVVEDHSTHTTESHNDKSEQTVDRDPMAESQNNS